MLNLFKDRLFFAKNWVKLLDLESERKHEDAYKLINEILDRREPKYLLFSLMAARVCAVTKNYEEANSYIDVFYEKLSSEKISVPDKLYLAAYAAWCSEVVSPYLGLKSKYSDFLQIDDLDFTKINERYKSLFPIPNKKMLTEPESFLFA